MQSMQIFQKHAQTNKIQYYLVKQNWININMIWYIFIIILFWYYKIGNNTKSDSLQAEFVRGLSAVNNISRLSKRLLCLASIQMYLFHILLSISICLTIDIYWIFFWQNPRIENKKHNENNLFGIILGCTLGIGFHLPI